MSPNWLIIGSGGYRDLPYDPRFRAAWRDRAPAGTSWIAARIRRMRSAYGRPVALVLLALVASSCGNATEPPEDHRILLDRGAVIVPGDRWVTSRVALARESSFEEREPALAPPDPVRMTVFSGPMPESRRYGTRVESRYWVEATRLGSDQIAVIQRFDYGRYWIRTRSTYRLTRDQANTLSRTAPEQELVRIALTRVRPIIAELARVSVGRD